MAKAILRFAKHKGSPAVRLEGHHERKKRNTRAIPILILREANTMFILSRRR